MRFKLVASITAISLLFGGTSPANAEDYNPIPLDQRERVFSQSWDKDLDTSKFWITYGALGGVAIMPAPVFLKNLPTEKFCETEGKDCVESGQGLMASGYATFCAERKQIPCVEKVEFRKTGDENWVEAQFLNYWDTSPSEKTLGVFQEQISNDKLISKLTSVSKLKRWKDDARMGLMGSAPGPMMFEAAGFESAAGSTRYLIEPYFFQVLDNIRGGKPSRINYDTFYINTRPIVEVNREDVHVGVDYTYKTPQGNLGQSGTGVGGYKGEYYAVDGRLAYAASFDPSVEVQITIQMPSAIGGWFHSRLNSPNLSLKQLSRSVSQLVISGASTEIPITNTAVEAFAPENKKYLEYTFGRNKEYMEDKRKTGEGGMSGGFWDPNNGLGSFEFWFSKLGPQAKGKISSWSVARMPIDRLGNNRCMNRTDRIQGLINTNAMAYQSLVPEYKNGFLNYQVAGVHLNLDGEVFKGQYDLIMRSDAARCLYRFSKAPVSGKVTVVDSKGNTEVSTTTLGEKNGWLRLSAKNFTFSKKTIRLKLTQKN